MGKNNEGYDAVTTFIERGNNMRFKQWIQVQDLFDCTTCVTD